MDNNFMAATQYQTYRRRRHTQFVWETFIVNDSNHEFPAQTRKDGFG